jgi:hypothetical protein
MIESIGAVEYVERLQFAMNSHVSQLASNLVAYYMGGEEMISDTG